MEHLPLPGAQSLQLRCWRGDTCPEALGEIPDAVALGFGDGGVLGYGCETPISASSLPGPPLYLLVLPGRLALL